MKNIKSKKLQFHSQTIRSLVTAEYGSVFGGLCPTNSDTTAKNMSLGGGDPPK